MGDNFTFTDKETKTLKDFATNAAKIGELLNTRVADIKSSLNEKDLEKLNEICGEQNLPEVVKEMKVNLDKLNKKIKSL